MSGCSTLVVRGAGLPGAGIKNGNYKIRKKNDCNTILIRTVTGLSALLRSTC